MEIKDIISVKRIIINICKFLPKKDIAYFLASSKQLYNRYHNTLLPTSKVLTALSINTIFYNLIRYIDIPNCCNLLLSSKILYDKFYNNFCYKLVYKKDYDRLIRVVGGPLNFEVLHALNKFLKSASENKTENYKLENSKIKKVFISNKWKRTYINSINIKNIIIIFLGNENKLTNLTVKNCRLPRFPYFNIFIGLTHLDLSENFISNIDLSKYINLVNVNLEYNDFTELPPIPNRPEIIINLSNNKIKSIEKYKNLNINKLFLSFNNIENIEILNATGTINTLVISNNKITSYINSINVSHLDISYNSIKYFNHMKNSLESISARKCISNIKTIIPNGIGAEYEFYKKIKVLQIDDIEDSYILENFEYLDALHISNIKIHNTNIFKNIRILIIAKIDMDLLDVSNINILYELRFIECKINKIIFPENINGLFVINSTINMYHNIGALESLKHLVIKKGNFTCANLLPKNIKVLEISEYMWPTLNIGHLSNLEYLTLLNTECKKIIINKSLTKLIAVINSEILKEFIKKNYSFINLKN